MSGRTLPFRPSVADKALGAMHKTILLLTVVAFSFTIRPAFAQTDAPPSPSPSRFGVGTQFTTLGVAVEGAVPVTERSNLRFGYSIFTLNHDFDNDGIDLTAQ